MGTKGSQKVKNIDIDRKQINVRKSADKNTKDCTE